MGTGASKKKGEASATGSSSKLSSQHQSHSSIRPETNSNVNIDESESNSLLSTRSSKVNVQATLGSSRDILARAKDEGKDSSDIKPNETRKLSKADFPAEVGASSSINTDKLSSRKGSDSYSSDWNEPDDHSSIHLSRESLKSHSHISDQEVIDTIKINTESDPSAKHSSGDLGIKPPVDSYDENAFTDVEIIHIKQEESRQEDEQKQTTSLQTDVNEQLASDPECNPCIQGSVGDLGIEGHPSIGSEQLTPVDPTDENAFNDVEIIQIKQEQSCQEDEQDQTTSLQTDTNEQLARDTESDSYSQDSERDLGIEDHSSINSEQLPPVDFNDEDAQSDQIQSKSTSNKGLEAAHTEDSINMLSSNDAIDHDQTNLESLKESNPDSTPFHENQDSQETDNGTQDTKEQSVFSHDFKNEKNISFQPGKVVENTVLEKQETEDYDDNPVATARLTETESQQDLDKDPENHACRQLIPPPVANSSNEEGLEFTRQSSEDSERNVGQMDWESSANGIGGLDVRETSESEDRQEKFHGSVDTIPKLLGKESDTAITGMTHHQQYEEQNMESILGEVDTARSSLEGRLETLDGTTSKGSNANKPDSQLDEDRKDNQRADENSSNILEKPKDGTTISNSTANKPDSQLEKDRRDNQRDDENPSNKLAKLVGEGAGTRCSRRKERTSRERSARLNVPKSPARTLPKPPPEKHPRKLVLCILKQNETADPWELKWDGKNLPSEMFETTDYHPPNIDLEDHFIESIPNEIELFANTLTVVNFRGNNLSHLPDGFFCLKNLRKLNLSANCFTEITQQFEELEHLEDLMMSHNYIENVPNNGPPRLSCLDLSHNCTISHGEMFYSLLFWEKLSKLNLAGNQIEKIPEYIGDLEELTELDVSYNELTEIPRALFQHESLQSVNLSNNFIKVFEPTVDSQLEELNISSNYLETVPCLHQFKNLKHLKCSNNYIEKVQGSLDHCKSLVSVDLSENYITVFELTGETLPLLEHITLDENYLKDFPGDAITLPNLQVLSCNKNLLTFLEIPRGISSLEKLFLSDNSLSGVHDYVPRGLPSLKVLDLSNNQLKGLRNTFSEFNHLETLNLNGNKLIHFPDALREGLPRLTNLSLDGSKDILHELVDDSMLLKCSETIKDLKLAGHELEAVPETLSTLGNMERLNISGNKLKKLPRKFLKNMQKLKHLDLSQNEFDQVPQEFRTQTNAVTNLNLSGNNIASLPINFSEMQLLQELYMGQNALHGLPPKFTEMKFIRKLQLSQNPLTCVPAVIWTLNQLEHLEMNSCKLKIFDVDRSATQIHHSLKFLDVGSNELEEIDESVALCASLKKCNFSHNNISDVDYTPVGELTVLRILDLSYNGFESFPTKLFECGALEELDLSHNRITIVEEENIDPKNNIKMLNLSSNGLSSIPEALKHLRRLEKLDIKDNKIDRISDNMEDGFPRLKSININNNQIQTLPKTIRNSTRKLDHCLMTNNKIQDIAKLEARSVVLQVDSNDLQAIPETLMEKQGLRDLRVRSNKLDDITFPKPQGRSSLTLQSLNISHNHAEANVEASSFNMHYGIAVLQFLLELQIDGLRLKELPDDIGDLRFLRKLTVRSNNLTTVPGCINRLRKLRYLDMSDNNIEETLPEHMNFLLNAVDFCELNMSKNKLTSVPLPPKQELKSKLERYILSENKISVIDRLITELSYMKELYLDSNKLKYVSERVFHNNALQKLDVKKNCIKAIYVPPTNVLEDSSLKELDVSDNEMTEVDSSLALFGRLEFLDLSYNNISQLPPNAGLLAKLKMRGLRLTGNPTLQMFSENIVCDYLTKTDAILKAKQGIKMLFHGNHLQNVSHIVQALMRADMEDESISEKSLAMNSIAVPRFFELDNFQVNAFICNPAYRYTLQQMASNGTIHVIVFRLDDMKDESTFEDMFTKHIGCFITEITTSMPLPIFRVIAVNKAFKVDGDELPILKRKVESRLSSYLAAYKDRLVSTPSQSEESKITLKRAEDAVNLFNLPSAVICISIAHIEDHIRDFQDDLRNILSRKHCFPRQPALGDVWVFFLTKLFEPQDQDSTPANFLQRQECIALAKECGIPEAQVNQSIDSFLYHFHETGRLFGVEEDGEVRMIFQEKKCYLDMLHCVLSSKNPEISQKSVQTLFDEVSQRKFSALQVLYVLKRIEYVISTSADGYVCPALLKTPGAAAILKKQGDIKKVPSSHEEVETFILFTSEFSFGAFFQLQYNLADSLHEKDGPMNVKSDGIWGECRDCKFFVALRNTEESAKYGFHGNQVILAVRIRGKVEEDAYDHGIQTVYEHKTLEKRRKLTVDDGFSSAVEMLDSIFLSLEKVKTKYPGISYKQGELKYILGDPPISTSFGDRVTRLVARKFGDKWKEFADKLPLDADKKQRVIQSVKGLPPSTTDSERIKLIIKKWKEIAGKKADVINLCKVLRACKKDDIADKVDALVKSHGKLRNEPL